MIEWDVQWHERVGSTNQMLLEAAAQGAAEGLVAVADEQTAGRGRRGRSWHAPPGTSLMASVLLRPSLPTTTWPLLTLMAGTALAEASARHVPREVIGLKWPNDLQLTGIKAAGILLETAHEAVVVGIGVNVDWRQVERPEGIVATSLAEHVRDGNEPPQRQAVLHDLLAALADNYARALVDPPGIVARYVPWCATLGTEVVAHGAPTVTGTAIGLTLDGHLRIRTPEGREVEVAAGEVEHLR